MSYGNRIGDKARDSNEDLHLDKGPIVFSDRFKQKIGDRNGCKENKSARET